jgi:hypothetical protein
MGDHGFEAMCTFSGTKSKGQALLSLVYRVKFLQFRKPSGHYRGKFVRSAIPVQSTEILHFTEARLITLKLTADGILSEHISGLSSQSHLRRYIQVDGQLSLR